MKRVARKRIRTTPGASRSRGKPAKTRPKSPFKIDPAARATLGDPDLEADDLEFDRKLTIGERLEITFALSDFVHDLRDAARRRR